MTQLNLALLSRQFNYFFFWHAHIVDTHLLPLRSYRWRRRPSTATTTSYVVVVVFVISWARCRRAVEIGSNNNNALYREGCCFLQCMLSSLSHCSKRCMFAVCLSSQATGSVEGGFYVKESVNSNACLWSLSFFYRNKIIIMNIVFFLGSRDYLAGWFV